MDPYISEVDLRKVKRKPRPGLELRSPISIGDNPYTKQLSINTYISMDIRTSSL